MKAFIEQRRINKCDVLDLHHAKYEDWVRYFGFNFERELMWYNKDNKDKDLSGKSIKKCIGNSSVNSGVMAADVVNKPAASSIQMPLRSEKQIPRGRTSVIHNTINAAKLGNTPNMNRHDPIQSQDVNPLIAEGMLYIASMSDRLQKADEVALQANQQLQGVMSIQVIADVLCKPYKVISWRQDKTDCALLKTRAVYRWICANIKVVLPQSNSNEGRDDDYSNKAGVTFGAVPLISPVNDTVPSKPDASGVKKTSVGDGCISHIPGVSFVDTESVPLKEKRRALAVLKTLENRAGSPSDIAELFTDILIAGGASTTSRTATGEPVDIVTVKGILKGSTDKRGKPLGYMQWGWNMVSIPRSSKFQHIGDSSDVNEGYKFLIDVSLSSTFVGPRAAFQSITPPMVISNAAPLQHMTKGVRERGNRNTNTNEKNMSAAANPLSASIGIDALDESEIQSYFSRVLQERTWEASHKNYSAATPKFKIPSDLSSHFEPFYFGCDPRHFVSLHYPDNDQRDCLLLSYVISRAVWESYPRLDHVFYKYGLKLDSHRRNTLLSSKAAPFFFSLKLDNCANVELAASLYKGTIADQKAVDWNTSSNALGPGYVYSVREEKTGRQTFTIMTPDEGQYTIVIGARLVNSNRSLIYDVSNELFEQVATFQVMMNFVALNEPILPHQHLTPATLKLVEPTTHRVLLGKQKFVVVPTTPRVLSVAVVNTLSSGKAVVENTLQKEDIQTTFPVAACSAVPPIPRSASIGSNMASNRRSRQTNKSSLHVSQCPVEISAVERKVTILPIHPDTATFEGEVDVGQGVVEIWALIGDPHSLCDGLVRSCKMVDKPVLPPISQELVNDSNDSSIQSESKKETVKSKHQNVLGPSTSLTPLQEQQLSSLIPVQPIEHANGSDGKIKGQFVRAISDLIVVKQIISKEQGLNNSQGVIQPVLANNNRLFEDLPFIFRLLSGTTSDGRQRNEDAEKLIGKPLCPAGSYFSKR